jgi:chorismate synthase
MLEFMGKCTPFQRTKKSAIINPTMNTFGKYFRVTTFGESHGNALGAVIDGCPAGLPLVQQDIAEELTRRRPGQSNVSTPRNEKDTPQILSGIFEEKTIGTPIAVMVQNADQKSKDYEAMRNIFRPGHADETWHKKYHHRDFRGGGRQSGRETLGRVIGGAVAKKLLNHTCKTKIIGHVLSVHTLHAQVFDENEIEKNPLRCADKEVAKKMEVLVEKAKKEHDSLGAMVEVQIVNPPPLCGSPVFGKIEAELAQAIMSIGTTRSFEYGEGIAVCKRYGSEQNPFREGISGGITTGEEIRIRIAIKPTPTIAQTQKMKTADDSEIEYAVHGRHDPIIAPRFVPVAEAMIALALADALLAPPDRVDQIFRK